MSQSKLLIISKVIANEKNPQYTSMHEEIDVFLWNRVAKKQSDGDLTIAYQQACWYAIGVANGY